MICYGGEMPLSLFVTLPGGVRGRHDVPDGRLLAQHAGRPQAHARRHPAGLRAADRQAGARDGIENAIPIATTLQKWAGVTEIEVGRDMLLVWAGNLLPMSEPLRAFASEEDARAFVAECERRAQG
jgi:hypothetical protein